MLQIGNTAILHAVAALATALEQSDKAREALAAPPPVDSTGHPAAPAQGAGAETAHQGAGAAG